MLKKVCLLVPIFIALLLFFPLADFAFDKSPQIDTNNLEILENKINTLNAQLQNIEKNAQQTYDYLTKYQENLAQDTAASLEIIRSLQENAAQYGVPFEIAYGVAKLESNLNPNLTCYNEWNNTYDRGLFQLNDNTSPWIAEHLGIEDFSFSQAYDVELNMKMGLWYLSYLHQKYDNWHDTLTAYNRGMYGLEKYKKNYGTSRSAYSRKILNTLD